MEASPRDIVYTLDADGVQHGDAARQLVCTDLRCGGVSWGTGDLAIVSDIELFSMCRVWGGPRA